MQNIGRTFPYPRATCLHALKFHLPTLPKLDLALLNSFLIDISYLGGKIWIIFLTFYFIIFLHGLYSGKKLKQYENIYHEDKTSFIPKPQ